MCDADADPAGGLVTFLPRKEDVEWRERCLDSGYIGHPPDTAWLCSRHARTGRELSTAVTIDVALAGLHDPACLEPIVSRRESGSLRITIAMWERVLRRALPDIAVELGIDQLELEYDAQSTCEPMLGLPLDVDPFPYGQQWLFQGEAGTVCMYSDVTRYESGVLALMAVVLMVSPSDRERFEVQVGNRLGSADANPGTVHIEGELSDVVRELLSAYDLPSFDVDCADEFVDDEYY